MYLHLDTNTHRAVYNKIHNIIYYYSLKLVVCSLRLYNM